MVSGVKAFWEGTIRKLCKQMIQKNGKLNKWLKDAIVVDHQVKGERSWMRVHRVPLYNKKIRRVIHILSVKRIILLFIYIRKIEGRPNKREKENMQFCGVYVSLKGRKFFSIISITFMNTLFMWIILLVYGIQCFYTHTHTHVRAVVFLFALYRSRELSPFFCYKHSVTFYLSYVVT